MPLNYKDYFTLSFKTYPNEPREGDSVMIVLEMLNTTEISSLPSTPNTQQTMSFSNCYFIFDPYNTGVLKYSGDRHNATLYSETIWNPNCEDNALSIKCNLLDPVNYVTYSPNNVTNGINHRYFWFYDNYLRLYFKLDAVKQGIADLVIYLTTFLLETPDLVSTGFLTEQIEVKPAIENISTGDLTLKSTPLPPIPTPKESQQKINQITKNTGDFNLEKLQINVRPASNSLIYVPDGVNWSKERGGS